MYKRKNKERFRYILNSLLENSKRIDKASKLGPRKRRRLLIKLFKERDKIISTVPYYKDIKK